MKILNRIVVFLLALSVLPIMYFLNAVRAVVSISESSSLYTILSKLAEGTANSAMELAFSLKELAGYASRGNFSIGGMKFDISKLPADLLVGKGWAIAAGVLLAVAVGFFIPVFTDFIKTGLVLKFPTLFVCCFTALSGIMAFFSGLILSNMNEKNRRDFEMQLLQTQDSFESKKNR